MRSILLVEDEPEIGAVIRQGLQKANYQVTWVQDGVAGFEAAQDAPFALIVLDLMLPGRSGWEVCRALRARRDTTPILMLTARDAVEDRVRGLEMGADDYLVKPFSIRELLARVKALFRRAEQRSAAASSGAETAPGAPPFCPAEREVAGGERLICAGDLVIERAKRRVTIGGAPVSLTAKEFDLLVQFACHPGRVYTRYDLLSLLWGEGYEGYEHTVNSHINRLRTKIEANPARPHYLRTVWGVGYKFAESAV